MVLAAAINGRADAIVTHNVGDCLPAAHQFGIQVLTPGRTLKSGVQILGAHTISVPPDLFSDISEEASRAGLDAQQWVTELLARTVKLKHETEAYFRERAARASGRSIRGILSDVPNVPPMPGDELPEG
jgi:hypothetical protein